ncbi:MAG: caspase family protein [Bacteroidota bacterium]
MIKRSLKISLLFLFFVFGMNAVNAQDRLALMIGIDNYFPENAGLTQSDRGLKLKKITNLDGCVNDVLAVKEVLTTRFGFPDKNIKLVLDQEASRKGILDAFENLISTAKKGDVVVIYYAGHGSQVQNSLSSEADKRDETMVPADAYKFAMHIRDKELAVLFQRLVDKGVILTVIYDSCHSGSIARGAITDNPPKSRFTDPDTLDARDAVVPPQPEKHGALILSAAQDDEVAMEQRDENGMPHGAFTYAFLQTMKTVPINSSAADIFSSIRAILKYNGKKQEPVIAGDDKRLSNTLFGIDKGAISGKTLIAVINNEGAEQITLQGGFAAGLSVSNTVFHVMENKDTVRLQITEMQGVNKCIAKIVKGKAEEVKAGDLYEIESWSGGNASLRMYVPKSNLTYEDVMKTAKNLSLLSNNKSLYWITDPVSTPPTHTVFYNGKEWILRTPDGKTTSLGAQPTDKSVLPGLSLNCKLFVSIPPYSKLRDELSEVFARNNAVEMTDVQADGQYYLTGRIEKGQLEYAFILPTLAGMEDVGNPMPPCTDFIRINPMDASHAIYVDTLTQYALKLAKLKTWLTLAGPEDDGSYPFYLALRNSATKQLVTKGEVYKKEVFGLAICANKDNLSYWNGMKRYIYVIAIDSKGQTLLCYPRSSVENKFPQKDEEGNVLTESVLGPDDLITIEEPLGIDTYILLSTDEPLPNPQALESSGVKTRSVSNSGLASLMNIGVATRGSIQTPATWSISRITVVCKEKK